MTDYSGGPRARAGVRVPWQPTHPTELPAEFQEWPAPHFVPETYGQPSQRERAERREKQSDAEKARRFWAAHRTHPVSRPDLARAIETGRQVAARRRWLCAAIEPRAPWRSSWPT